MSSEKNTDLKERIAELEEELRKKDSELITYRKELVDVSRKLDGLMGQILNDIKILNLVQKQIVPTEIPKIAGVEISKKFVYGDVVGGDYFDIFEHNDKFKFGLLVASSSGYSMSALFMSLMLKMTHVIEAKKGVSPESILQNIAKELKDLAGPTEFSSAFYGVIDRRDFSLTFCSVGDVSGFYLDDKSTLHILKSKNKPISQGYSEKLTQIQLDLAPKSKLCILTEGITSILGYEKISKIIQQNSKNTVHELRNDLLFEAQKITKRETPERDQTGIVLAAKERVIKLAK